MKRTAVALLAALSMTVLPASSAFASEQAAVVANAEQVIIVTPAESARADMIAFAGAGFAAGVPFTATFIDPIGNAWHYFLEESTEPAVIVTGEDGAWAVPWHFAPEAIESAPLGTWTAKFVPQDGSDTFWTVDFSYVA